MQNSIVTGNDRLGRLRERNAGGLNVSSLGHNLFGNPAGCGNLQSSDLTGDAGVGALVDSRPRRRRVRSAAVRKPRDRCRQPGSVRSRGISEGWRGR